MITEQPRSGMFVLSKTVEEMGRYSLFTLITKTSIDDSRLMWYPDGSLSLSWSQDNVRDLDDFYRTHCQHVTEFNAQHTKRNSSFESRIRMSTHSELPNEVADVRVWGKEIARRRDKYAIGYLTKRWPEVNAIEPALNSLVVTIIWAKKPNGDLIGSILKCAKSFNQSLGSSYGPWVQTGRVCKVAFFKTCVQVFCDFSSCSFHDFIWFVLCFAKSEQVQRCECFSIVQHQIEGQKLSEFVFEDAKLHSGSD